MVRDDDNKSSDSDSADEPNDSRSTQTFLCPECPAKFPNLSKLKSVLVIATHEYTPTNTGNSKHRNTHLKPYACYAPGCSNTFAQRQALDRHAQVKHGDTEIPTKFYHCTVDGCKYSSTNRRKKSFTRVDQLKEHIKDYGHYGPHSSNERARRPGKPLFEEHIIKAVYEEWTLDSDVEGAQHRRTIQSCQYHSIMTKLWHTDDTGELYLHGRGIENIEGAGDRECPAPNCYYKRCPPDGLAPTLFKLSKSLHEHYRRAHETSAQAVPLTLDLKPPQLQSSISNLPSTVPKNFHLDNDKFGLGTDIEFKIWSEIEMNLSQTGPQDASTTQYLDIFDTTSWASLDMFDLWPIRARSESQSNDSPQNSISSSTNNSKSLTRHGSTKG
jgi:hypothetical protein